MTTKTPTEIQRLRRDIEVLESATGVGLPFDRREARRICLGSLLGMPAALWALFGPTQPPIGSLVVLATLVAVVVASSLDSRNAHKARAEEPLRWREHRFGLALFLFVTFAALGYLTIGVWGGLSWDLALPTAVFLGGIATSVPAIADRRRLYLLGGGFWTLAYAAVIPLCDDRQLMLATALWIFLAATTTAAILFWQLRDQVVDDAY